MKTHFNTLAILFLLTLFTLGGCKKTKPEEAPKEQKTERKIVLKAVIKDDGKTEYQYNEFGKVERINRFSNATGLFEYLIYDYTDNQLKQIRKFGPDYESNEMALQNIYKVFYRNNKIARIERYDANKEDIGNHLFFKYQDSVAATGPLSAFLINDSGSDSEDYIYETLILDNRDNIIKEHTIRKRDNHSSTETESEFEYDNSINPLYGLDGFEKMLPPEYAIDDSFNLISFLSPNNCVKALRKFEAYRRTISISSVYTYNENKMPLKLKTKVTTTSPQYVDYDPSDIGVDPIMVTTVKNFNQQFEYQTITLKVIP